jgi:hypothetical protein
MAWTVKFQPAKVERQAVKLSLRARKRLRDLIGDLALLGPELKGWPHYSQLKRQKGQGMAERRYHCHLSGGKDCVVACWRVQNKTIVIEVYYVGSHQKAPY